jgi:hypothetical protein
VGSPAINRGGGAETLAALTLVHVALATVLDRDRAADLVGAAASVVAAQLYLVAGVRKLRAPGFMSGRVVVDNLAYAWFQGAAGHPDFPRLVGLHRLSALLEDRRFLRACRAASVAAAAAEVAVGLGAAGLLPRALTLAVAVPLNVGFLAISPKRIVAFVVSAFGLVVLATANPVLPLFG